jgi:uncharacterized membrane protein YfcA
VEPGPLRDALTVVAGVGTGALSGAFGVGGAVVSTPALRALGASATIAIGTTLPSILPSAATGTVRYHREKLILWRVVALTVPTGIVASVGGSLLSKVVPGEGHLLMLLTAGLLGITAWRMIRPPVPRPSDPLELAGDRARPTTLAAIGAAAGGLSGLLGIGGGIIMVPAFVELADIPVHAAVATSLVAVGVFAVPGTVTHALLGDINWTFALLLCAGVIPGAGIGAAAAMRATAPRLRLSVGWFLGAVAVIYAAGELAGLRR